MVELIRCYHQKYTEGELYVDNVLVCLTLEHPWKNNLKKISCIPEGQYTISRFSSELHPDTYHVDNVPGRDGILFHVGNRLVDTHGCILTGMEFVSTTLGKSQAAFKLFMRAMDGRKEDRLLIDEED